MSRTENRDGNLAFIVLALISARGEGAHGYRLRADFDALFGDTYSIGYGKLYRTLNDLNESGDLALEIRYQNERPNRKVYTLTEQGSRTLRTWLSAPSCSKRSLVDDIAVKLMLADPLDLDSIATLVREHRRLCLDRLTRGARRQRVLRQTVSDERISKLLIDGAEARIRADLAWLEQVERQMVLSHPLGANRPSPARLTLASAERTAP